MNAKEARELCQEIRAAGIVCKTPKQFVVKDQHCAMIHTIFGDLLFYRRDQWEDWRKYREDRKIRNLARPRSPIEVMIDQACGITAENYDDR